MIVVRIVSAEVTKAMVHPAKSGSRQSNWRVISNANTIEVNKAREAPAKLAAIPIRPAMRKSTPAAGVNACMACPISTPTPPPIVKIGATAQGDGPRHEFQTAEHRKRDPHEFTA